MRRVFTEPAPAARGHRAALAALGVRGDDVEPFLFATALALPGWAGMFARLERHPEEHPGGPPTTLADFMAVRLLLERRAVEQRAVPRGVGPPTGPRCAGACRRCPPRAADRSTRRCSGTLARAAGAGAASGRRRSTTTTLAALWQECAACTGPRPAARLPRSLRAHVPPHDPRRDGRAPRPAGRRPARSGRARSSSSASTSARSRSAARSRSSIPATSPTARPASSASPSTTRASTIASRRRIARWS